MIKRLSILILAFLMLLVPGLGWAQDGITVLDSAALVDFPDRLTFELEAEIVLKKHAIAWNGFCGVFGDIVQAAAVHPK